MQEVVNKFHPDKVADRIAGALVDYCYKVNDNPKCAVEVLIGHGLCTIIVESNVELNDENVLPIVHRIAGDDISLNLISVKQDEHLAENQVGEIRCGDNGIFRGVPMTSEDILTNKIAMEICERYPSDGKYVFDEESGKLIVCQSCCETSELSSWLVSKYPNFDMTINPLGDWIGGTNVDTGATNRKLGSDMGRSVTGGGLNGKDLSKADVCVNIYAWLKAQETGENVEMFCAIGDTEVNGIPYSDIVETAREYIDKIGGFEKFAEWGLK